MHAHWRLMKRPPPQENCEKLYNKNTIKLNTVTVNKFYNIITYPDFLEK